MPDSIQFETPENIQISYQQAGLGTRFLAWFVDMLLLMLTGFFFFMVLICGGVIAETTFDEFLEPLEGAEIGEPMVVSWAIGIFILVVGLGSFFYFGLSELMLRGQTVGKRMSKIRVVNVDGFGLNAIGILVRNIFRVIDQVPALWIVPLLSIRGQRFGDMVSGTLVIRDEVGKLPGVRERLNSRSAADAKFRFDSRTLKKLQKREIESIEKILERWSEVSVSQRDQLLEKIVPSLVVRLEVELPATADYLGFLEDLLAAEYRRQNRELG